MLLGSQRQSLSKHDLGYNPILFTKGKRLGLLERASNCNACIYCGGYVHVASTLDVNS